MSAGPNWTSLGRSAGLVVLVGACFAGGFYLSQMRKTPAKVASAPAKPAAPAKMASQAAPAPAAAPKSEPMAPRASVEAGAPKVAAALPAAPAPIVKSPVEPEPRAASQVPPRPASPAQPSAAAPAPAAEREPAAEAPPGKAFLNDVDGFEGLSRTIAAKGGTEAQAFAKAVSAAKAAPEKTSAWIELAGRVAGYNQKVAIRIYEKALATLVKPEPKATTDAVITYANSLQQSGDAAGAIGLLTAATLRHPKDKDPAAAETMRALHRLAEMQVASGRDDESDDTLRRLVESAVFAGKKDEAIDILSAFGEFALNKSRHEHADRLYLSALTLAYELDLPEKMAEQNVKLGELNRVRGIKLDAVMNWRAARDIYEQLGEVRKAEAMNVRLRSISPDAVQTPSAPTVRDAGTYSSVLSGS